MFTFVLPGFKLVVTFVPGKPFSIMRLIYLSLFIYLSVMIKGKGIPWLDMALMLTSEAVLSREV